MVCYSDLYCVAETKVLFHSILMINIAFSKEQILGLEIQKR